MSLAPVAPRLPAGLETPCLVVELDTVARNISRMAEAAEARGVRLRPHVKTHKSVRIAEMQLAAGASGITVGTLGEAEVFAAAAIEDILVAYPIWAEGPKAARVRALHDGLRRFAVGIDSIPGAERLAAAVAGAARPLHALVEIDPGNRRTGVPPDRALDVALAARSLGLVVDGVFCHGGHSYRGPDAVAAAAEDEIATLSLAVAGLRAAGFEAPVVSAGSTPTAVLAAAGEVTEIRPGTYVLGDRHQLALGAAPPDGLAAWVAATVVSASVDGQVVLDSGAKALTKDRASYVEGHGYVAGYPKATIDRLADYHGMTRIPPGSPAPALGEVVAVLPNHICPVVDLYDSFVAVRGGSVVGRWPVDARGRSG
ncbi:MAG TPA: alanine racemase [Candidatus Limnocylindrales bacterium]